MANFMPELSVSTTLVDVYTSPQLLGINYRFGRLVKVGYEYEAQSASQESRSFLELFGMIRLTAGWRTIYTPEGRVISQPFYSAGSPPKKPKALKIRPIKIEEKPRTRLPIP
jgi:hypothetical protein